MCSQKLTREREYKREHAHSRAQARLFVSHLPWWICFLVPRDIPSLLTAVRSERERVCVCVCVCELARWQRIQIYFICCVIVLPSTDDGVYLSLDTFITPCLPIQRFTHGLCINLYAFFVFAAVHFSSPILLFTLSSLIRSMLLFFFQFTNTAIGTPPPQTHTTSWQSMPWFLMRWCPVRNLTNTPQSVLTNTAK